MLASWLQSIHGRVRVLIRPDNNRARDRLPVFQHTVANWQEKKHICSSCHSEERWSLKVNIKNKLKQILSGSVAGKKKKKKSQIIHVPPPPPSHVYSTLPCTNTGCQRHLTPITLRCVLTPSNAISSQSRDKLICYRATLSSCLTQQQALW